MPIGHYETEGEYFERLKKKGKRLSKKSQGEYTYGQAVEEAYDKMAREELTPMDTMKHLVDARGVDSETAKQATVEAMWALKGEVDLGQTRG